MTSSDNNRSATRGTVSPNGDGRPAPIKAIRLRHPGRITFAVILIAALALFIIDAANRPAYGWDNFAKYIFDQRISQAAFNTLMLTVYSMLIAIVLGITLAVMRLSDNPVVKGVAWLYLWIFRGTPVYVQLVFWGLISTIYAPLNQYRVVMQAAQQYQNNAQALNDVFVVGSSGQRVPLSALAHYELTNTPLAVNHQGLFVSSTLSFNLDKGVSLSSIQGKINEATAAIGLPSTIHGGFQGTAQLFASTLKNQPLFIMAAIFAIYIVLGMLYESTLHPLTILSTLPPAGVGAVLALQITHTEFSIIALIGVFLLIGIVKKNAILMVDFALSAEREHGMNPRDAIYRAATLRLRPILMTTLAALGTALPLAFITGNGAELRQPLGISIAGGLIVSQALTLYTTPVIYLELDRLRRWTLRRFGRSDRPPPPEGHAGPPQVFLTPSGGLTRSDRSGGDSNFPA